MPHSPRYPQSPSLGDSTSAGGLPTLISALTNTALMLLLTTACKAWRSLVSVPVCVPGCSNPVLSEGSSLGRGTAVPVKDEGKYKCFATFLICGGPQCIKRSQHSLKMF